MGLKHLDGDTVYLCPHDPAYLKFEQLKLTTEYDESRNKWICGIADMDRKIWRLPKTITHGKTKREAEHLMHLAHEGRVEEGDTTSETAF